MTSGSRPLDILSYMLTLRRLSTRVDRFAGRCRSLYKDASSRGAATEDAGRVCHDAARDASGTAISRMLCLQKRLDTVMDPKQKQQQTAPPAAVKPAKPAPPVAKKPAASKKS